jgi:predicted nucleic acid-binding protein
VKAFLDTSVLVPAFLGDHDHHERSLDLFLRFDRNQAACAAHSLAEFYATVTRMPGKHRVPGEQAMLFLQDIRLRLRVVSLDESESIAAIERASAHGITGGTVYDALIAACAVKAGASALYTWNVRHFQLLGPDLGGRVKTP